jgi:hypothetical protein
MLDRGFGFACGGRQCGALAQAVPTSTPPQWVHVRLHGGDSIDSTDATAANNASIVLAVSGGQPRYRPFAAYWVGSEIGRCRRRCFGLPHQFRRSGPCDSNHEGEVVKKRSLASVIGPGSCNNWLLATTPTYAIAPIDGAAPVI